MYFMIFDRVGNYGSACKYLNPVNVTFLKPLFLIIKATKLYTGCAWKKP